MPRGADEVLSDGTWERGIAVVVSLSVHQATDRDPGPPSLRPGSCGGVACRTPDRQPGLGDKVTVDALLGDFSVKQNRITQSESSSLSHSNVSDYRRERESRLVLEHWPNAFYFYPGDSKR